MSDRCQATKRKRHWSDTAQDQPSIKRRKEREDARHRLRKMSILTLSYSNLRRFASKSGNTRKMLLNFLTARTLRDELVEELLNLYWTDPACIVDPWESYFSTEHRPIEQLVWLREKTGHGIGVAIDRVAFDQEMGICCEQLFRTPPPPED